MESSAFVSPATRSMLEALDIRVDPGTDWADQLAGAEPLNIPADQMPRTPSKMKVFQKCLGAGRAMVISGAEWFSRKSMGQVYKAPDPLELEWCRLQFHILRQLMKGGDDDDQHP
jgi:hypothetical protein